MAKILWNSKELPLRYFWIPEGEEVFEGDYSIENGESEIFSVDLESLVPFEIESDEAEALMLKDLEDMTKELGGLFKGLFKLGGRMLQSETMEEESEDWDDESESESEDWNEKDLKDILSLLEEDSESESSDEDESLQDLLNQFTDGLGSALEDLGGNLAKELESLGAELDTLGSEAANALDKNPEAGQEVLRELGQWLINIADEANNSEPQEDVDDDEVVVMQFRPKQPPVELADDNEEAIPTNETEEITIDEPITENDVIEVEENAEDVEEFEEDGIAIPPTASLKRLTKAKLIELGQTLGLKLSMKQTKQTMLDAIETLR